MNIPNKVRIGSIDYDVLIKSPLVLEGKQCNGMIDYSFNEIHLDDNIQGKQTLECTFLHEVVHGLLYSRGLLDASTDETLVEELSKALHQFIRDNPEVFKDKEQEVELM